MSNTKNGKTKPIIFREVWLSGANGFIGKHLSHSLKEAYSRVQYFTNNIDAKTKPDDKTSLRHYMDFSSEDDIRRNIELFGLPDIFIHLGWGAMADPTSHEHLAANVEVSKTIINTLFKAGLEKFIFLGSGNEYGGREGSLSEDMAPGDKLTAYAQGKTRVASFGFEQASKYNKKFISIRLFNTFGSGQRPGSLINKLYDCYRKNIKPELGPCEHFRDYIHVSEVAEGITRICGINESTIVNLGSGKAIKLKDFVILFWKSLGGQPDDLEFGAHPMRAGEPGQPYAFASTERLRRLTGWAPSLSIEDGIRLTIEGLKAK
jgi:nucleoside-diphosphate-sugar epimerase